jgi:uncharacterized protein YqhQ
MMRSRERAAVAVRRPDGGIEMRTETLSPFLRSRWARLPLVRGLITLWYSLGLGLRALTFSADVASGSDVQTPPAMMWGTVAFSFALGLGLFFVLPAALASALDPYIAGGWISNLVEGLVRLTLFLSYLVAIGRIPDIKRVFAYHGAEHRVINAYEAGEPLTVERIRAHDTFHPRCGTGFLLIVVLVSVVVFGFLGQPPLAIRLLTRIAFVPLIAAVSYEFVRLAATHRRRLLARALLWPSLLLQGLTTREPSDDMLEVAEPADAPLPQASVEPEQPAASPSSA